MRAGGASAVIRTKNTFPRSGLCALIAVSDDLIIFREEPGKCTCRVFSCATSENAQESSPALGTNLAELPGALHTCWIVRATI
jgi:hypothetical protein